MSKLEVPIEVCRKFIRRCEELNIIPMTTCFCTEHVKVLKEEGFQEIKIASYDCASPFLLKEAKNNFNHLYVSTGATFDSEIKDCVALLKNKFSLLHCVTRYPTPLEHLNLERINFIKEFCSSVGYSDHSKTSELGVLPACAAIYTGAEIIERHFSILPESQTRDGIVSIGKKEIKEIIGFSLLSKTDQKKYLDEKSFDFSKAMGNKNYAMSLEEYKNRLYYRGRFASVKIENGIKRHVFNWEQF